MAQFPAAVLLAKCHAISMFASHKSTKKDTFISFWLTKAPESIFAHIYLLHT